MLSRCRSSIAHQVLKRTSQAFRVPSLFAHSSQDLSPPFSRLRTSTPRSLIKHDVAQKCVDDSSVIKFSDELVGSLELKVTNIPGIGPFFLDETQHYDLERAIATRPQTRPLILSGTIKSGKSVLLKTVIPGMVVAQKPKLQPIFLYHEITESTPTAAVSGLMAAFQTIAKDHGVVCDYSDPDGVKDLGFFRFAYTRMAQVVRNFSNKGCELWILLDEAQAPCLSGTSSSSDSNFFSFFKQFFLQCCHAGGRVVMTGSGMMSLLVSLSQISTNGTYIWGEADIVSRGHAYNSAVFKAMIEILHKHFKPHFPPILQGFVTSERILAKFQQDKLKVSMRPALLSYFLHQLTALPGTRTAQQIFDGEWAIVLEKLSKEANVATAFGLREAGPKARFLLYQLVWGQLSMDQLLAHSPSLHKIVYSLMEHADPSQPDVTPSFQPPYGSLFQKWILPDGRLNVDLQKQSLVHLSPTQTNFNFIFDKYKKFQIVDGKKKLSEAVEHHLFEGRKPTNTEIWEAPQIQTIFKSLLKDESHRESLDRFKTSLGPTGFSGLWGFQFFLLVRHFLSHVHNQPSLEDENTLDPRFFTSLAECAATALVEAQPSDFQLCHGFLCDQVSLASLEGCVPSN